MDIRFIYITCPNRDEAERIGRALVDDRLAACVNVIDGMRSIYRWQGEVCEDDETVIVDITGITNGVESGTQQATTTIIDECGGALLVTSLHPTSMGFVAEFSNDLDTSTLNLYDTQTAGLGPADVVLQGATSGEVAGSLVVDPSSRMITFIKKSGPLVADRYTVTLRSGTDGFKSVGGVLLDGDGNGTAGDDFSDTFLVPGIDVNAITVSLPDFVRGPGQDVKLPANTTTGIPETASLTNA